MLSDQDFQQVIEDSSAKFAQLIEHGDLDALVPSCPGWTFTELAQHMCGTQRWSTHALLTGERGEHPQAPNEGQALLNYFKEGAKELIDASRTIDPLRPTWSFGPEPRIAQFWTRRQAHEITIHLWDAYASQEQNFDFPADLALDGLNEIHEVFFPMRVKRGNLTVMPQTIVLVPNESTQSESLPPESIPPASLPRIELTTNPNNDGPRVEIHGRAADLLLLLWGRKPLDSCEIIGDAALAQEFLAQGVTP